MSSCTKVKNPCKICLGNVTQKNGLQCQGVCESWVHYSCLNYTPGKIRDIKSGIIKVTCPCPDCKTSQPKEFRTDEGYSCDNQKCPANRPPKCDNKKCPANIQCPSESEMKKRPPCPLSTCGTDCKAHSSHNMASACSPPSPCGSPSQSESSSSGCPTPRCGLGDTQIYSVTSLSGVEHMCNTVGQLTNQINDLMLKMKQVVAKGPGCYPTDQNSCSQKGSKAKCPKPCYCPGNPRKKR